MTMNAAFPRNGKVFSAGANEWRAPEFKVSGIFGSHMVLQRDAPIAVRGFSDAPGSVISGEFMGESAACTVAPDCTWTLRFSARACTRAAHSMHISDDRGHAETLCDILIGDVYLIGGQSNAELNLAPCLAYTPGISFDENAPFRLFAQHQSYPGAHKEVTESPQRDIICPDWRWKRPDEAASRAFSAMGWYFADMITRKIDIPIGMIMIAAGGACLRELMSLPLARSLGYFTGANVPVSGYYHSLIHPVHPLPCKAMLYFQGESEGGHRRTAEKYADELALLVEEERRLFGHDFAFYNVQLSDYGDNCFTHFPYLDIVRIKQFEALSRIPGSTLTVDMDLGAPDDYEDWPHSPLKQPLAQRLANLVLAREYAKGDEAQAASPMPVKATRTPDGRAIDIRFKNAPLCALDGRAELLGFSVGNYDARVPAAACISSPDTVRVTVPEGADASRVNYAYSIRTPRGSVTLSGANGLPCPAFSLKTE